METTAQQSLAEGAVFKTYTDFELALESYCRETNAIFVKKNARTVEGHNKSAKTEKGRYPPEWKYVSVRFECKHYGTYNSVSTGKRKEQDTFKTGCSARLLLSGSKAKGGLVINQANLEHTGHNLPTDDASRKIYPEFRRISTSQKEELISLLSLGVSANNCVKYAKGKFNVDLLKGDINNLKVKARESGHTEHQEILTFLKSVISSDEQASADICTEEDGTTSVIFLQTSYMKAMFQEYGSVIFLDSTYRVNNRNMPLFVFMIMDGDHRGQVVAYALVTNESSENVQNILQLFIKNNNNAATIMKTVMIDKDFSCIKALTDVVPSCSIILCKWHVIRAFQRSLKGYESDLSKSIMACLHGMLQCSTLESYEHLKGELRGLSATFHDGYFDKNWHSMKESWVGCYTRHALTYGNFTNNVVESHNQKIKFLVNGNAPLTVLLQGLLQLNVQACEKTAVKKNKLKLKKKLVVSDSVPGELIQELYETCSPYAAKIVADQMEKVHNQILLVSDVSVSDGDKIFDVSATTCNCLFFLTKKLPCAHIIAFRKEHELTLFSLSDVPHQFRLSTFLSEMSLPNVNACCTTSIPPSRKILNRNEKFNKVKVFTSEMASVISEFGQQDFEQALDMVRSITNSLKQGKTISWVENERIIDDDSSETGVITVANSDPLHTEESVNSQFIVIRDSDNGGGQMPDENDPINLDAGPVVEGADIEQMHVIEVEGLDSFSHPVNSCDTVITLNFLPQVLHLTRQISCRCLSMTCPFAFHQQ